MHTRQGGAAHVNIFYFLIILVMFFGVLGFGYLQLTRNAELEVSMAEANTEMQRLTDENRLLEHYKLDISAAINLPGDYRGRPLIDYGSATVPVEGVADIELIQQRLQQLAVRIGVPEANGLPEFLSRVDAAITALNTRITDGEAERQQLMQQKSTADAAFTNAAADAAQRERDLNSQMESVRSDFQGQLDTQQSLMTQLNSNMTELRDQLSSEQEARAADVQRLTADRNLVQAQLGALREKYAMINPPQAPDGRVITASQQLGRAFIDLGRKDMLQPGTVFRISDPESPGTVKAMGTVTRIQDAQAEIAISNLVDAFDPVSTGDLISNDLYSPNVRRNIYLMGRFGVPYSKEDVKGLLQRLGNTVVDRIQPGVDLVIVGNNLIDEATGTMILLDETPEYRQVLDLGIEVAPLNRIRDFLHFDR